MKLCLMLPDSIVSLRSCIYGVSRSPRVHIGFLQVFRCPPTSQKHASRLIGDVKLPQLVNECVRFPVMDWHPSQDIYTVFPPCVQCSWDRFRIYHEPDQDKVLIGDQRMNGPKRFRKSMSSYLKMTPCVFQNNDSIS